MSPPAIMSSSHNSTSSSTTSSSTTSTSSPTSTTMTHNNHNNNNNNNNKISSNNGKHPTYIARLFVNIESCLQQLGIDTNKDEVIEHMEGIGILIHESMSISSRNYHSVQHVFDISKDLPKYPIAVLAALFHDCVYYNIDGGLSPVQAKRLRGCLLTEIKDDRSSVLMVDPHAPENPLLAMILSIFGLQPGQIMTPMTGLNEFLSAVIAVRELADLFPSKPHGLAILAQIACCIEATIPFRKNNVETGQSAMDRLYDRMVETNIKFELEMTEEQVIQAVQHAVLLANEDVGNFGSEDRSWFLDNTWSLLPESNEALRQQYLYTVFEFQFAVFKMYGFFAYFLTADVIFQQFRGVPSQMEIERRTKHAEENLVMGKKYVAAKLLSLSVLAAFAQLTGGDAPISLFMGDLPSRHRVSRQLEDSLPQPLTKAAEHCDEGVYDILAYGRRRETSFDVRHSPLAAYFYTFLGDSGIAQILTSIKVHPMTAEVARSLLNALPPEAVKCVGQNMAKLALSRKEQIENLLQDLKVL